MTEKGRLLSKKIQEGFEKQIPDNKIRHIIVNAMDVFSRKGLSAAKIKDIAAKAGFSQGFIYNYFKSKDDIFTKIVSLAAEGSGNSVKMASELPGSPYERIFYLTEALLSPDSLSMQHWRLILIQTVTRDAIPEEAKKIARENAKKPVEYLIPMIVQGQEKNEIVEKDPVMLAVTYFSIMQGLGIARIQGGENIPFPPVDLILSFLKRQK